MKPNVGVLLRQAPANLVNETGTHNHMSALAGSDGSACCLELATVKSGLHVEPADGALDVLLVVVSAAPRHRHRDWTCHARAALLTLLLKKPPLHLAIPTTGSRHELFGLPSPCSTRAGMQFSESCTLRSKARTCAE